MNHALPRSPARDRSLWRQRTSSRRLLLARDWAPSLAGSGRTRRCAQVSNRRCRPPAVSPGIRGNPGARRAHSRHNRTRSHRIPRIRGNTRSVASAICRIGSGHRTGSHLEARRALFVYSRSRRQLGRVGRRRHLAGLIGTASHHSVELYHLKVTHSGHPARLHSTTLDGGKGFTPTCRNMFNIWARWCMPWVVTCMMIVARV